MQPREEDYLRHLQTLRRTAEDTIVRPALETAILRGTTLASKKFQHPEKLYYLRSALEQASSHVIATQRAQRYRDFEQAIDLGCSIGGDLLALAQVLPVIGVDIDALRLHMAQANLADSGLEKRAHLIQCNLTSPLPLKPAPHTALFFDPARRVEYKRVFSTQDYQPPLSIIKTWLPTYPHLGVKLSPGVNWQELLEYTNMGAEVEFISVQGDLKEAILWFGELASTKRRATLLPQGKTLTADVMQSEGLAISTPLLYLYEPDPAILRAGLVADLGKQIDACQLDADIAYLTGEHYHATPFGRAWQVLDWFPFQLKRLRTYLRAHNVGEVIIKKRGSPLEPEALMRDLRLSGNEKRTLFLTHLKGKPIVIIAAYQEL